MNIMHDVKSGFLLLFFYALIITFISLFSALKSKNTVFPSFFFDPSGIYSIVNIPAWDNQSLQLSRNNQIIGVGSEKIDTTTGYLNNPGNRVFAVLNNKYSKVNEVPMYFRDGATDYVKNCPLKRIGNFEILILYVIHLFFGWFSFLFTLILWNSIKERKQHINVLLVAILLSFTFLVSFFDYHTVGFLVPLFQVSNITLPLTIVYLCFVYPYPLVKVRFATRGLSYLLVIYFLASLIDQVMLPVFNIRPFLSPVCIDSVTKYSFLLAAVLLLVRILVSRSDERNSFIVIGVVNCVIILLLGVSIAASLMFNISTLKFIASLFIPFVPTLFILLFSYSVIRHNVLTIRTVFKRKIFFFPILFLALALTVATYTLFSYWSDHLPRISLFDACAVIPLLFVYIWVLEKITSFLFFNSVRTFKPTIAQLSDHLSAAGNEQEIAEKLCFLIKNWLSHYQVYVKISSDSDPVTSDLDRSAKSVSFPMLSHGKVLGIVTLTSDAQSPLLTEEDHNLLRIIAGIGAIGINNIKNMNKLDTIYKQNIDLTRKENLLSLRVFSAEIVHEIQYPVRYFKFLLEELEQKQTLNTDDIKIGNDEIRRLEQMVLSLQKLKHPPLNIQPVNVFKTVQRVLTLLKDTMDQFQIISTVHIPESLTLSTDKSMLIQLFSNLLKNAIEASGDNGKVSIIYQSFENGSCTIDISDSGPGLPDGDIFSPWVSTKNEGRGIGLTVCMRIVRSFDWNIEVSRENNSTSFHIRIPRESIVTGS